MTIKPYKKISVIGGGSVLWTPDAVAKMASTASICHAEVTLYDVRYEQAVRVAEACSRMLKRSHPDSTMKVHAAKSLEGALTGTDAVITCFCNLGSGVENRIDEISKKYGSNQHCYTAGPGALLYLAIQGPVLIDVVEAMRKHCPDAWLINCSNPLPAMIMVAVKAGMSSRKALGFCGALSWEHDLLAKFLQVEPERVDFRLGGTNHCSFYTEVYLDGMDASPLIRKRGQEQPYLDLGCWGRSATEIEILNAVGYLPPGGHPSDIFPTLQGEWIPPGPDAPPKPKNFDGDFLTRLEAYGLGGNEELNLPKVREVPFSWLDALAGDTREHHFSINITNDGAVPNLPAWAVPDLECHIDRRGVTPFTSPALPEVIAEIVRRHQITFEMAARAIVGRDRKLLREAIQLCPFGDYMRSADKILEDAARELGAHFFFQ